MHLTPFTERPGFRAGASSAMRGTGVEAPLVPGLDVGRNPLALLECCGVVECAFAEPAGFA